MMMNRDIVIDMCEKFYNDRLRNDRALVHWKSDNNNPKTRRTTRTRTTLVSLGDPFRGPITAL